MNKSHRLLGDVALPDGRMLNRELVQQETRSGLAIQHFAVRGGDLVYLVYLVCLVHLVSLVCLVGLRHELNKINQTNEINCLKRRSSGQSNIHHSTLSIPPTPPSPHTPPPHRLRSGRLASAHLQGSCSLNTGENEGVRNHLRRRAGQRNYTRSVPASPRLAGC